MSFACKRALWLLCVAPSLCLPSPGQSGHSPDKAANLPVAQLQQRFFDIVRDGDALQFLSYIPEDGVNLGRDAQHTTRAEIEEQLTQKKGLYCKLFDSACLSQELKTPSCSYRDLLTASEKVRLASTETTRNTVRQAILIAQVENQKCGGTRLIDFIFNRHQDKWQLFSIP